MRRTMKLLGFIGVAAAAGVAAAQRLLAEDQPAESETAVADHNICRELNQAIDRFGEHFRT